MKNSGRAGSEVGGRRGLEQVTKRSMVVATILVVAVSLLVAVSLATLFSWLPIEAA
jgi:hypothetical protein